MRFYVEDNSKIYFISIIIVGLLFLSCDRLPDYGTINEIPKYYDSHLNERVAAINNTISDCSDNCETFFWITDMHWEPDLNTRHAPALIKHIASKTGISKVLNGGDTGNSQIICTNAINSLRDAIGSNSVYSVNGNHEINDASRYESPFERVHKVLRGHCNDITYGNQSKSYFYFDNINSKTRYIGLSTYGLFLNNRYASEYVEEQLSWFRNVALNVEHGWTIIIFTHSMYCVGYSNYLITDPKGANAFIDTIDNYNGDGIIACVLMGHSHIDRLHIGPTGVPYIISACDRHVPYQNDINVERKVGTISEQHFEVVIVDKVNRKVFLYAIGANARDGYDNNVGQEVDLRCVAY